MAGNSEFDQILSTTLKNYIPRLTDNIFSARPLFYALTNGQTIRRVSGGAKIVVPVIYGTNSTAASYAGTYRTGSSSMSLIICMRFSMLGQPPKRSLPMSPS